MLEVYKLVLTHNVVDEKTFEQIKLDEPISIEHIFDREYGGISILLNRMFDELKAYALAREDSSEDETD